MNNNGNSKENRPPDTQRILPQRVVDRIIEQAEIDAPVTVSERVRQVANREGLPPLYIEVPGLDLSFGPEHDDGDTMEVGNPLAQSPLPPLDRNRQR